MVHVDSLMSAIPCCPDQWFEWRTKQNPSSQYSDEVGDTKSGGRFGLQQAEKLAVEATPKQHRYSGDNNSVVDVSVGSARYSIKAAAPVTFGIPEEMRRAMMMVTRIGKKKLCSCNNMFILTGLVLGCSSPH